jgi:ribosome-binding protein aMBF1 (putative translation factor)
MEHQDWATLSIHNPQKKTVQKEIVQKKGDNAVKDTIHKLENDNAETFKHTYIPSSISKEIVKTRVALKLSQKELAQKMNLQQNIYVELENGKALYSVETKKHITQLERLLKVPLKVTKCSP